MGQTLILDFKAPSIKPLWENFNAPYCEVPSLLGFQEPDGKMGRDFKVGFASGPVKSCMFVGEFKDAVNVAVFELPNPLGQSQVILGEGGIRA